MKEPIISEKHVEVEISQMKVTDGRKRKEKQRLWLQRPMTARLVFHGKNSEQKLVVLEGRAPAQATDDGTRLVKVKQATISKADLDHIDEILPVICPTLIGNEAFYEIVVDQCDEKLEAGTRIVINPFDPVRFGRTPLEEKGGRWAGAWATHLLLTRDTFCVPIPHELSDFAATTIHTMALAFSACQAIIDKDEASTIVVQGAGLLGLYCCALLSSAAFSVFCCDKSAKRLRLVTEFGGVPLHPSLIGPIESKANFVIECTGDADAPSQAYAWLGENSEYIILGLSGSTEPLRLTGAQIISKSITIRASSKYSNENLKSAVNFMGENRGKYPWHKLTGPNFELAEWDDAITTVRQGDYYRVLFRPEAEIKERKLPQTVLDHEQSQSISQKKVTNQDAEVL